MNFQRLRAVSLSPPAIGLATKGEQEFADCHDGNEGSISVPQMIFDQAEFDIRCEWGLNGIQQLAGISDAIVIVDILSFATCVSIAVTRGAIVFPYRWKDDSVLHFARTVNAVPAGARGKSRYSLSPVSLREIPRGTRLVLPSPNGSALTFSTGKTATFAGCLRNSKAVARAAARCGPKIGVIPAGERWDGSDSLRLAFEDLVGAGAVIRHLTGSLSPEARLAVQAFDGFKEDLLAGLTRCSSSKELIAKGFQEDVLLASELDVDPCAPRYSEGAYRTVE